MQLYNRQLTKYLSHQTKVNRRCLKSDFYKNIYNDPVTQVISIYSVIFHLCSLNKTNSSAFF